MLLKSSILTEGSVSCFPMLCNFPIRTKGQKVRIQKARTAFLYAYLLAFGTGRKMKAPRPKRGFFFGFFFEGTIK